MDAIRVRLVRIDEAILLAAEAGRLEQHSGIKVGPVAGDVHESLAQVRTFLAACPGGAAWLGVDDGAGQIVGTCAFKSGVNSVTGEIEIAYHTYPPFEGRGHARAMARGLVALAAGGEAGVRRLLEILRADLERTLILAGLPAVAAISPDTVTTRGTA